MSGKKLYLIGPLMNKFEPVFKSQSKVKQNPNIKHVALGFRASFDRDKPRLCF